MEGIDWSPISTREDLELAIPFSLEEIRKVAFNCDRNKSFGPNGFSMAFFQDKRNLIKSKLEGFF